MGEHHGATVYSWSEHGPPAEAILVVGFPPDLYILRPGRASLGASCPGTSFF
jgi:hypothetical protein